MTSKYIPVADRRPVVYLLSAKRIANSVNGNPRYLFCVSGGDTYKLARDAGYGYAVTNYSFPRHARLVLNAWGTVHYIEELTTPERISARIEQRRNELNDGWQYTIVYDRDALLVIQASDPDGWSHREPKEEDYAAFTRWALNTYGEDIWVTYAAGGWGDPPTV
jgi:hypothetical protein